MVKVLGVTMSCRDFLPSLYWINQIDFIDRLLIKNYWHEEGHSFVKDFFMKHDEYTHLLFLCEDSLKTPDMVKLIIKDAEENDFPVVAGYSNIDFSHEHANISFKDLRKIKVSDRRQYEHPKLKDVVLGKYGFPFIKVTFQGNTLALYRRDIVEQLSFKPYKRIFDRARRERFFADKPLGIMFDLQMCNEVLDLGYDIIVDVRLNTLHYGFGLDVIDFSGKERYIDFIPVKGEPIRLETKPPYGVRTEESRLIHDREWFREKFLGIKKEETD